MSVSGSISLIAARSWFVIAAQILGLFIPANQNLFYYRGTYLVGNENITYRYDNNALLLLQCLGLADVSLCDSASPDNILLENVTSLEFRYLDENGSGLGDPDPLLDPVPAADLEDIRTVVITMTVEEPAGRSGTVDRTYTTRVHCRNMGLE